MTLTLFDEIGGKVIGVYGATGIGKSTVLNDFRERVTAMPDAILVQLNGAHMGDELTWEPLAAATACGPAAATRRSGTRFSPCSSGRSISSPNGPPLSPRPGTPCSSRPRTTRPSS